MRCSLSWPELIRGTLVKRYKRFLAEIKLENGDTITAHCPNSGRMTSCSEPGRPVYVSANDSPRRKLKYTWEIIDMPDSLVGVNTQIPNRLVYSTLKAGVIKGFDGYCTIRQEVRAGLHTRFDLMLSDASGKNCYVEIKNSTLVENSIALFPDAVTSRGKNHLVELQKLVKAGHRCIMFFLVQRMDAKHFRPADHVDPAYGRELRSAVKNGVEMVAYDVHIDLETISLRNMLPYDLP
jgi:sugar fermentation stimulation protein A